MQGNNKDNFSKVSETYKRHVVLISPEIHWNTGNIGRTCLGAKACLHLIKPLGFSIKSSEVRRAGLDYWHKVKLFVWDNFDDFCEIVMPCENELILFSKSGKKSFWNLPVTRRCFLVFGSETKGIPKEIFDRFKLSVYKIPISDEIRCLNLSTSVGIVLYESIRQSGVDEGDLF